MCFHCNISNKNMHFLHNYRCISNKITRKISCYLCFCLISPIQTLLSALESHQINCCQLAGYTAGGELHPAPKVLNRGHYIPNWYEMQADYHKNHQPLLSFFSNQDSFIIASALNGYSKIFNDNTKVITVAISTSSQNPFLEVNGSYHKKVSSAR